MTNDIKKTVEKFHYQFNLAETDEERQQLATAHKAFVDQLTPEQKILACDVSRPYLLNAVTKAEAMESVLQRAKEMLKRHEEHATKRTTESVTRR